MSACTVTVFGCPCDPAVRSTLNILTRSYNVRFATCSQSSQSTLPEGVTTISISQNQADDFITALEGAHACVVFTKTDFNSPETEVSFGKSIAQACAKVGIQHVVFSTQISVLKVLGIPAKHMDNKADIELEMKRHHLPLTCIILPCCYEQFLSQPLVPTKEDGRFYIDIPMGDVPLNMISAEDVGPIIARIIELGPNDITKTQSVSALKQSCKEIAATMKCILTPHNVYFKQITLEQFKRKQADGITDYGNMFDFYKRVDQQTSIRNTQTLYSNVQTFEQWLNNNKQCVIDAMNRN